MQAMHYAEARRLIESALAAGELPREQLARLYGLRGEVEAVLDGAEAGERDFRKALVLDERIAPTHDSPVMIVPFRRAQEWLRSSGGLQVELAPPPLVEEGTPGVVALRVGSDPLGMVDSARLFVRVGTGEWRRLVGLRAPLPEARAGETIELWAEVVDLAGDVLRSLGGPDSPLRIQVVAPRPRQVEPRRAAAASAIESASAIGSRSGPRPFETHPEAASPPARAPGKLARRRLLGAGIGLAVVSAVLLGAGLDLDLAAMNELDRLRLGCAPFCTSQQRSTLHLEEDLAGTALIAGGAALVASAVLLLVDWRLGRHGPAPAR